LTTKVHNVPGLCVVDIIQHVCRWFLSYLHLCLSAHNCDHTRHQTHTSTIVLNESDLAKI